MARGREAIRVDFQPAPAFRCRHPESGAAGCGRRHQWTDRAAERQLNAAARSDEPFFGRSLRLFPRSRISGWLLVQPRRDQFALRGDQTMKALLLAGASVFFPLLLQGQTLSIVGYGTSDCNTYTVTLRWSIPASTTAPVFPVVSSASIDE